MYADELLIAFDYYYYYALAIESLARNAVVMHLCRKFETLATR